MINRQTTLILTWREDVTPADAHNLSRKIASRLSENSMIESARIVVIARDKKKASK